MKKVSEKNLMVITNELNRLWTGMFIAGGGGVGLLMTHNTVGIIFGIIGIVLCICLIARYFAKEEQSEFLLNYLNEKEK